MMHVHGVGWVQACETESPAGSSKTAENTSSYQAVLLENQELTLKVRHLEERVRELEKSSSANLLSETAAIVQNASVLANGPDTPDHLEAFTLDTIITKLKTHAPNLLQLVLEIGETSRNMAPEDTKSIEGIKALTALCTLLNARSARVKGIQLMTSLMLIARATSRQVSGLHAFP